MTFLKKSREANMDLLRIVSMLLIIFLHSIDHSGVLESAENGNERIYFYVRFTYAMCMVCVNIYVMLSGYFMVKSKFRLQKLVSLWIEAAFYSFTLKLVFMLFGDEPFSIFSLISCIFPILTGRYWFLTIYVGMYLISPFLNILIYAMNKGKHGLLNLCLFAIMSVWTSIHPIIAGMNSGGGWGLAWFVVLYLVAAWLKLYYTPPNRPFRYFLIFIIISLFMATAQYALRAGIYIPASDILRTIIAHWFRYDSAPVYIMSISLFMGFMNIRIHNKKTTKVIVSIAPLTLGVYLIHAHANVSPWSWEVLNLPVKMASAYFPLIQFGCVAGIFIVCIIIDAIREITIGKLENSDLLICTCEHAQEKLKTLILKYFKE